MSLLAIIRLPFILARRWTPFSSSPGVRRSVGGTRFRSAGSSHIFKRKPQQFFHSGAGAYRISGRNSVENGQVIGEGWTGVDAAFLFEACGPGDCRTYRTGQ
jgi:hypothetical protein